MEGGTGAGRKWNWVGQGGPRTVQAQEGVGMTEEAATATSLKAVHKLFKSVPNTELALILVDLKGMWEPDTGFLYPKEAPGWLLDPTEHSGDYFSIRTGDRHRIGLPIHLMSRKELSSCLDIFKWNKVLYVSWKIVILKKHLFCMCYMNCINSYCILVQGIWLKQMTTKVTEKRFYLVENLIGLGDAHVMPEIIKILIMHRICPVLKAWSIDKCYKKKPQANSIDFCIL